MISVPLCNENHVELAKFVQASTTMGMLVVPMILKPNRFVDQSQPERHISEDETKFADLGERSANRHGSGPWLTQQSHGQCSNQRLDQYDDEQNQSDDGGNFDQAFRIEKHTD